MAQCAIWLREFEIEQFDQFDNFVLLFFFITGILAVLGISGFLVEVIVCLKEKREERKLHHDAWKKGTIIEAVKAVKR